MPIYVYECQKCGHTLEYIEAITTTSDTTHPCPIFGRKSTLPPDDIAEECGGVMRRIPSRPAPAKFNCSMPTYQKPKG